MSVEPRKKRLNKKDAYKYMTRLGWETEWK